MKTKIVTLLFLFVTLPYLHAQHLNGSAAPVTGNQIALAGFKYENTHSAHKVESAVFSFDLTEGQLAIIAPSKNIRTLEYIEDEGHKYAEKLLAGNSYTVLLRGKYVIKGSQDCLYQLFSSPKTITVAEHEARLKELEQEYAAKLELIRSELQDANGSIAKATQLAKP